MASDQILEAVINVKVQADEPASRYSVALRVIALGCTWGTLLVGLLLAARQEWTPAFFYVLYAHVVFSAMRKERAS